MKKTSLEFIKTFTGGANTPTPRSLIQLASQGGKQLDRNSLEQLSAPQIIGGDYTAKQEHILDRSIQLSRNIYNQTSNLIGSSLAPTQHYLSGKFISLKNSSLRDKLLLVSTPAVAVFGLLSVFRGVRAISGKSQLSSGAELTKGFIAFELAKKLAKITTAGGFKNHQEMKQQVNAIKTRLAILLGLTAFQQFYSREGIFQQFFSDNFKSDVVDSLSWTRFLNPVKILGAIFSGNSLENGSRALRHEAFENPPSANSPEQEIYS